MSVFGQTGFDSMLKQADALKSEGKIEPAVQVMRQAIKEFPENARAHQQLGSFLGELGRVQSEKGDFVAAMTSMNESFSELDKACGLDPDLYDAHFLYGVIGVNVPAIFGKLAPAVVHLEKARDIQQKRGGIPGEQKATLLRYLGQGYLMQGKFDDAESSWKQVLAFSQTGGNADAARKGMEEAMNARQEAAAKQAAQPALAGDVKTLLELGKSHVSAGKWADAVDVLRKAAALDTTNAEAQWLFIRALSREAQAGYDGRIYQDQNWRTNLAFEIVNVLERAKRLAPDNAQIRLTYAVMCIQMPFFTGRMDEGLTILEAMSKDLSIPDSTRKDAIVQLGFGYRKKGRGIWADFVKRNPDAAQSAVVFDEYGLREFKTRPAEGERVQIDFHLGFMDELEPQTALWVEDAQGKFVKTLYVSGFSGFAKEKQVVLPEFAQRTQFETDGTTGASIDWGTHTYFWAMDGHDGKKVKPGNYSIVLEISWWPAMQYALAEAEIKVGSKSAEVAVEKGPLMPRMRVRYMKEK
jgi:tetratricopeptide (TPR) repeat protein